MAGVKTAISVEKKLFDRVDNTAAEMNISRSRLFSLAMEDYLKKLENIKLLEDLNAVYETSPSYSEEKIAQAMKQKQKRTLSLDPW